MFSELINFFQGFFAKVGRFLTTNLAKHFFKQFINMQSFKAIKKHFCKPLYTAVNIKSTKKTNRP